MSRAVHITPRNNPYLSETFVPNCFEDLEEPPGEVVHLDGLREGFGEKLAVVRHPVHQSVQNRLRAEQGRMLGGFASLKLSESNLQLQGLLELLLRERRRQEEKRRKVQGVSIERILSPHADA